MRSTVCILKKTPDITRVKGMACWAIWRCLAAARLQL